jgi:hypothetical protein
MYQHPMAVRKLGYIHLYVVQIRPEIISAPYGSKKVGLHPLVYGVNQTCKLYSHPMVARYLACIHFYVVQIATDGNAMGFSSECSSMTKMTKNHLNFLLNIFVFLNTHVHYICFHKYTIISHFIKSNEIVFFLIF